MATLDTTILMWLRRVLYRCMRWFFFFVPDFLRSLKEPRSHAMKASSMTCCHVYFGPGPDVRECAASFCLMTLTIISISTGIIKKAAGLCLSHLLDHSESGVHFRQAQSNEQDVEYLGVYLGERIL